MPVEPPTSGRLLEGCPVPILLAANYSAQLVSLLEDDDRVVDAVKVSEFYDLSHVALYRSLPVPKPFVLHGLCQDTRFRRCPSLGMAGFRESISIPALLPGAEHSYWWWRLKVNHEQITCSKKEYCEALVAEGVKMNISYDAALPFLRDWFQNRPQKHPWNNPLYKGDSARSFPCPNALTIMQECFNLTVFESWGEEEAGLVAKAFQKVDRAFRK